METTSVSNIYSLNKSTYINLRWIGIIGQFLTINIVYFIFKFQFNIYLTNLSDFPLVNEIMTEYFSEPYPARAVVGVSNLPKGAMIEMDAIMTI